MLHDFGHISCQLPCPESGEVMASVQNRLSEMEAGSLPIESVFDSRKALPIPLSHSLGHQAT